MSAAIYPRHCRAAVIADLSVVIAGLDPAIHRSSIKALLSMDARVKPGHDDPR
jgi:hypothetical protein